MGNPEELSHLLRVSLDDKYAQTSGRWYMTGSQALVKIPLLQKALDQRAGLNTRGFISGYRGSPLGGYDQQLWKASRFLNAQGIKFQPGVNEELSATAVWGSQQVNLFEGATVDGVYSILYAKSPGIDRAGDALRHANAAGSSKHGGVLVLAGDDHAARSASVPNQSELALSSAMIPIFNPAFIQDYLELGLHAIALSRYSGLWTGMTVLAEIVDGSASVEFDLERFSIQLPDDYTPPAGGLNIRWPDPVLTQEHRLLREKVYAAQAYARANSLNRRIFDSPAPRFGIVATGKAYFDVRQALHWLGIDEATAREAGIRLMKVDLIWPLEPESMRSFAAGLEEILVVEEKRPTVETQLKDLLYNETRRPMIVGKTGGASMWAVPSDDWLLPPVFELDPGRIARVLGARLLARAMPEGLGKRIRDRLAEMEAREQQRARQSVVLAPAPTTQDQKAILTPGARTPYYCSGCPHNTSTRVPEGSRALAGIGCHFMAMWIYGDQTATFTQMGGEGVNWVGQAPFTTTRHVFANLGDGTYFHSGFLAVRQSIAAKVNVTYKILYNDAVAMTGGQPIDGVMSVAQMAGELLSEGVAKLAIVTDEPGKYAAGSLPAVEVFHRDHLDQVQRDLREVAGCTVLIYDQTCAAEKRRRRKRHEYPDPPKRMVINDAVCEGCGDCSEQSHCISVVPLNTALGTKRAIDQSTCNKDYSCVKGFCPSFVTVVGGQLRKSTQTLTDTFRTLPEPVVPSLDQPRRILIGGIGGTGVVTMGALLGMAAHLDGKAVAVLDMTGLAQKGGAVFSHVQIAQSQTQLNAARLVLADVFIACEATVALEATALKVLAKGTTRAIVSTAIVTAAAASNANLAPPSPEASVAELRRRLGTESVEQIEAGWLATTLLGDSILSNSILVGFAWQRGEIPLSHAALVRAIELNGVAVDLTKAAFEWGRRAAVDLPQVMDAALGGGDGTAPTRTVQTLDEAIAFRCNYLVEYQNAAYAGRFSAMVDRILAAERRVKGAPGEFAAAAAAAYFRMLAIKDEYEVARLMTLPRFLKRIEQQFEGDYRLVFNLAPPVLAHKDPSSGKLQKKEYSTRFMLPAFRLLARMRGVRGTWLDPFRYSEERREHLALLTAFERELAALADNLDESNYVSALRYVTLTDEIRGYGHVRSANAARVRSQQRTLLASLGMH